MTFCDIKEICGRLLPATMRGISADEVDEYTELVCQRISFGMKLDDSYSSLQ